MSDIYEKLRERLDMFPQGFPHENPHEKTDADTPVAQAQTFTLAHSCMLKARLYNTIPSLIFFRLISPVLMHRIFVKDMTTRLWHALCYNS